MVNNMYKVVVMKKDGTQRLHEDNIEDYKRAKQVCEAMNKILRRDFIAFIEGGVYGEY